MSESASLICAGMTTTTTLKVDMLRRDCGYPLWKAQLGKDEFMLG